MTKQYTLPRGMKDIDMEEMLKRLWITDKIRKVMKRYGFNVVDPTQIENLDTLEAKSGTEVRDEIYHFLDKAGRHLGLRFDLTVGMTRMIANRFDLPEPIKLCAISGMWRYDEPQFARYRYFWQWDAEIYGVKDPIADAEIISLGMDVLEELGFREYMILLSSRNIIDGIFEKFGISDQSKRDQLIRIIDKKRKISEKELKNQMMSSGLTDSSVSDIWDFISMRGNFEKILSELSGMESWSALLKIGLENLKKIADYLNALGKRNKCLLDLSIVRGIDYYDGVIFEAYDKNGEDIGSIFGGGRYDRLGRIYGKRDLPATGVAGGIERLMISLERFNLYPELSSKPQIFVASVSDDVKEKAMEIVQKIRDRGVSCDFDLKNRSLRNQLSYVDSMSIPYVILIGLKELEEKKLRIKMMMDRKEIKIALNDLDNWLNSIRS